MLTWQIPMVNRCDIRCLRNDHKDKGRVKHILQLFNSVLNVKALVAAFNQEKALVASRGLLRDCEIFGNLQITFVSSSSLH